MDLLIINSRRRYRNQSVIIPDVITCRVVTLVLVQFPLDDYHGRCLVLSLAAVRNQLMRTVPCGQDESPRYRHDDHDIVQAHVRHIDQIHRQDLVTHLHVRMHGNWRTVADKDEKRYERRTREDKYPSRMRSMPEIREMSRCRRINLIRRVSLSFSRNRYPILNGCSELVPSTGGN